MAAARAVIFSQMVADPSARPDRFPTEKAQARERERLFGIIKKLVKWENINDAKTHPIFPITTYCAFKQSEIKGDGSTISTGWETA